MSKLNLAHEIAVLVSEYFNVGIINVHTLSASITIKFDESEEYRSLEKEDVHIITERRESPDQDQYQCHVEMDFELPLRR